MNGTNLLNLTHSLSLWNATSLDGAFATGHANIDKLNYWLISTLQSIEWKYTPLESQRVWIKTQTNQCYNRWLGQATAISQLYSRNQCHDYFPLQYHFTTVNPQIGSYACLDKNLISPSQTLGFTLTVRIYYGTGNPKSQFPSLTRYVTPEQDM